MLDKNTSHEQFGDAADTGHKEVLTALLIANYTVEDVDGLRTITGKPSEEDNAFQNDVLSCFRRRNLHNRDGWSLTADKACAVIVAPKEESLRTLRDDVSAKLGEKCYTSVLPRAEALARMKTINEDPGTLEEKPYDPRVLATHAL